MAERFQLPAPMRGLSEAEAFSSQPPLTSRTVINFRLLDPKTGRRRFSKRAGRSNYVTGQLNGTTKIKHILQVAYDEKRITYSNLASGSEETVWTSASPTTNDAKGIQVDRQQNVYLLDGATGLAKLNPEKRVIWKISLPVPDKFHVCNALLVDEFDGVYAGVSSGGDNLKGRLYKYVQLAENKTEKAWEVETKGYVKAIKRKDSLLYTAQDFPDKGESYIVVYSEIDGAAPSEEWRSRCAYPANDIDVDQKTGNIAVASQPNARRGIDPRSPHTTAKSVDWTPKDLTSYEERIWAWHDPSDPENLAILPRNGFTELDGGKVEISYDISGRGRHLYTENAGPEAPVDTDGPERAPTWRRAGIGGLGSLKFTNPPGVPDTTPGQSMTSEVGTSVDRADRADQLQLVPRYKGAQFALFMVVRFPIEDRNRILLGMEQPGTTTDQAIVLNRDPADSAGTQVVRPGSICIVEDLGTASDASASTTACLAPTGLNGQTLPGSAGTWGHAIITWVFDGGLHDVFGTATRSMLRVNGRPCDRWQTARDSFYATERVTLGYGEVPGITVGTTSRYTGEVGEIIVLSDWDDADGVRQRLIESPSYPDANPAANSDTEIERIEGYLAHKWGLSHELPGGYAGVLTGSGGTNVSDGETVTIDTIEYTFKTVLTGGGSANEVLIGADQAASFLNLAHAINHTGQPGIDYAYTTTYVSASLQGQPHPSYRALWPMRFDNGSNWCLQIVAKDPYATGKATTETCAAASWAAATTQATANGSGGNRGHYPHPFFLRKTSGTAGGPPSKDGAGLSKIGRMNSVYGILSKHDPAKGNVKWVAASGEVGNDGGVGAVGGVGYACAWNTAGELYSLGPVQPIDVVRSIPAEAIELRKIIDKGDSYNLSGLGGTTDLNTPWETFLSLSITAGDWTVGTLTITKTGAFANYTWTSGDIWINTGGGTAGSYTIASRPNADTIVLATSINGGNLSGTVAGVVAAVMNKQPRLAVDKFDNLYVPYFSLSSDTKSALVYQRASSAATVVTAVLLHTVNALADDSQAYACAVATVQPEYGTDLSTSSNPIAARAEFLYLATRKETATNTNVAHKLRLVTTTLASGSPRTLVNLAIAGAKLKPFTTAGFGTEIGTDAINSTAQFIDSAVLYQKAYISDGRQYLVYDPKLTAPDNLVALKATSSGKVPPRCKLVAAWRGRLVLARDANNPHNWHMSKVGDPLNWDFFPPVITATQAVSGNDSRAGVCPDIINALVPYSDDFLIFGGNGTIQRMTGDPMAGGQFDLVTDATGMAFGPSWDKDENGILYFVGSKGGLYAMESPLSAPVSLSEGKIERKLRDIDFATYYVRCVWNARDRGLHIFVEPFGDGGTQVAHYFWQRDTADLVPFQDYFGTSTNTLLQPTSARYLDDDALAKRVLVIGTEDGQILKWDESAKDDGATFSTQTTLPIYAKAVIGPLTPGDGQEWRFSRLKIQLGNTTDGCLWRIYSNDVPDAMREPKDKGNLRPGQNPVLPVRIKGHFVWLELQAGVAGETFSYEGGSMLAEPCGRARQRT